MLIFFRHQVALCVHFYSYIVIFHTQIEIIERFFHLNIRTFSDNPLRKTVTGSGICLTFMNLYPTITCNNPCVF